MAYFADLTPYCFLGGFSKGNELNVGWLDNAHDFPRGPVPGKVLEIIFELCKTHVNQTRGTHFCQLCPQPKPGYVAVRNGTKITLGGSEIRVKGNGGIQYASPNMIYHYIKDHAYQPPQEFIDAILALDTARS
jgi:hypothetical protein